MRNIFKWFRDEGVPRAQRARAVENVNFYLTNWVDTGERIHFDNAMIIMLQAREAGIDTFDR